MSAKKTPSSQGSKLTKPPLYNLIISDFDGYAIDGVGALQFSLGIGFSEAVEEMRLLLTEKKSVVCELRMHWEIVDAKANAMNAYLARFSPSTFHFKLVKTASPIPLPPLG